MTAFRVAQEAVQNAIKHSGAGEIDVRLNATAAQLVLRVTATGRGFDPFASRLSGMGLLTMREQVELSGGTLTIDLRRGGTTIDAVIPLGHSSRDVA